MREIKFRGKNIDNNKWVYGSYFAHQKISLCMITKHNEIEENTQHLIIQDKIACDWGFENGMQCIDVDKETVGQYTDLKDKNGKKIYEGDIVELHDKVSNIHWTAIVEFGNPNAEYTWGWQLKPLNILEPTGTKQAYWNKDILLWVELEIPQVSCEVIGNIYDNPELLKEIEDD